MPVDRYKSTRNSQKIRQGCFSKKPYTITTGVYPPSEKQISYINLLVEEFKKSGVEYEYILNNGRYLKSYHDADRCLSKLKELRDNQGMNVRYLILCENRETGERKQFLMPKALTKPKGWEYIGLIRKVVTPLEE